MPASTREIAEYARRISFDDLPEEAVDRSKRIVLDTLGCALGAYTSPPSKVLRACFGGKGDGATVVGSGERTSVEYATLINSALARYLDYNDTYLREGRALHPSDHVPALLAVGEAENSTGKEVVEAISLAYEIEGAGRDAGVIYETGVDYVSWGALSCTAAAGKLMGLSEAELRNAIGIAGASSLALGIVRHDEISMWKGVAHAYVNHNAVQACIMARAGMTGPQQLFEGTSGFFETVSGGPFELGPFGGQEGHPFRVTQSHIKPYPCGYYMQTAIEATLELREQVETEDVERVTVDTFQQPVEILAGPEKWATDLTRESADHSIPYTVAVALLDGEVTPEQYDQDHRDDERVHSLMGKVEVNEDPELNAFVRENTDSLPMDVRVETGSDVYRERVDYPLGHATRPMSDERLEAKFEEMALELLTGEQVERTFDACYELETLEEVSPLLENLVV